MDTHPTHRLGLQRRACHICLLGCGFVPCIAARIAVGPLGLRGEHGGRTSWPRAIGAEPRPIHRRPSRIAGKPCSRHAYKAPCWALARAALRKLLALSTLIRHRSRQLIDSGPCQFRLVLCEDQPSVLVRSVAMVTCRWRLPRCCHAPSSARRASLADSSTSNCSREASAASVRDVASSAALQRKPGRCMTPSACVRASRPAQPPTPHRLATSSSAFSRTTVLALSCVATSSRRAASSSATGSRGKPKRECKAAPRSSPSPDSACAPHLRPQ